jgi:hypothetical protein
MPTTSSASSDSVDVITFSIPRVVIEAAFSSSVNTVLSGLFSSSRTGINPAGYKAVEKAITDYVEEMALPESAITRINAVIEEVLPKAVEAAVKNRAGTLMAEIIRSGALDERIAQAVEARLVEARGGGMWT